MAKMIGQVDKKDSHNIGARIVGIGAVGALAAGAVIGGVALMGSSSRRQSQIADNTRRLLDRAQRENQAKGVPAGSGNRTMTRPEDHERIINQFRSQARPWNEASAERLMAQNISTLQRRNMEAGLPASTPAPVPKSFYANKDFMRGIDSISTKDVENLLTRRLADAARDMPNTPGALSEVVNQLERDLPNVLNGKQVPKEQIDEIISSLRTRVDSLTNQQTGILGNAKLNKDNFKGIHKEIQSIAKEISKPIGEAANSLRYVSATDINYLEGLDLQAEQAHQSLARGTLSRSDYTKQIVDLNNLASEHVANHSALGEIAQEGQNAFRKAITGQLEQSNPDTSQIPANETPQQAWKRQYRNQRTLFKKGRADLRPTGEAKVPSTQTLVNFKLTKANLSQVFKPAQSGSNAAHLQLIGKIRTAIKVSTRNLPSDMKALLLKEHGGTCANMGELLSNYQAIGRPAVDNVEKALLDVMDKYTKTAKQLHMEGDLKFNITPHQGNLRLTMNTNNQSVDMLFNIGTGGKVQKNGNIYWDPFKIQNISGKQQVKVWGTTGYTAHSYMEQANEVLLSLANPEGKQKSAQLIIGQTTRNIESFLNFEDSIRPGQASQGVDLDYRSKFIKPRKSAKAIEAKLNSIHAAKRGLLDRLGAREGPALNPATKSGLRLRIAHLNEQATQISAALKAKTDNMSLGIGDASYEISKHISERTQQPLYGVPQDGVSPAGPIGYNPFGVSKQASLAGAFSGAGVGVTNPAQDASLIGQTGFPLFHADPFATTHHSSTPTILTPQYVAAMQGRPKPAAAQANIFYSLDKASPIFQSGEGGEMFMVDEFAKSALRKGYEKNISLTGGKISWDPTFLDSVKEMTSITPDTIVGTNLRTARPVTLLEALGSSAYSDLDEIRAVVTNSGGRQRLRVLGSQAAQQGDKISGKKSLNLLNNKGFARMWGIEMKDVMTDIANDNAALLNKAGKSAADIAASARQAVRNSNLKILTIDKQVSKGNYEIATTGIISKAASDAKMLLLEEIKANPQKYLERGTLTIKPKYIKQMNQSVNNFVKTLFGTTGKEVPDYLTLDAVKTFNPGAMAEWYQGTRDTTDNLDVVFNASETSVKRMSVQSQGVHVEDAEFWEHKRSGLEQSIRSFQKELGIKEDYSIDLSTKGRGFLAGIKKDGKLKKITGYAGRETPGAGKQFHKLAAKVTTASDRVNYKGTIGGVQYDLWKRLALVEKGMTEFDKHIADYVTLGQSAIKEQMKGLAPYLTSDPTLAVNAQSFSGTQTNIITMSEALRGIDHTNISSQKIAGQYRVAGIDGTIHEARIGAHGKVHLPEGVKIGDISRAGLTKASIISEEQLAWYQKLLGKTIDTEDTKTVKLIKDGKSRKVSAFYVPDNLGDVTQLPTIDAEVVGTPGGKVITKKFYVLDKQHRAIFRHFQDESVSRHLGREDIDALGASRASFDRMLTINATQVFGGKESIFGQAVHKTRLPGFVGVGKAAGYQLDIQGKGTDAFKGMLRFNTGTGIDFVTPTVGENWLSASQFRKFATDHYIKEGMKPSLAAQKANEYAADIISGKRVIHGEGHRESTMSSNNSEGMRHRLFEDNKLPGTNAMGKPHSGEFSHAHIRNMISFTAQGGDTDADLYYGAMLLDNQRAETQFGIAKYNSMQIRTYGPNNKIDYVSSGGTMRHLGKLAAGGRPDTLEALRKNYMTVSMSEIYGYDSGTSFNLNTINGQKLQLTDNYAFGELRKALRGGDGKPIAETQLKELLYTKSSKPGGSAGTLSAALDQYKNQQITQAEFTTQLQEFASANKMSPESVKAIQSFAVKNQQHFHDYTVQYGQTVKGLAKDKSELIWTEDYKKVIEGRVGKIHASIAEGANAGKGGATLGGFIRSQQSGLKNLSDAEVMQELLHIKVKNVPNYLNEKLMTPAAWKESRSMWQGAVQLYGKNAPEATRDARVYQAIDHFSNIVQQSSMSAKHAIPLTFASWRKTLRNLSGRSYKSTTTDIAHIDTNNALDKMGERIRGSKDLFGLKDQILSTAKGAERSVDLNAYRMISGDQYMRGGLAVKPQGYDADMKSWGIKINPKKDYLSDRMRYSQMKARGTNDVFEINKLYDQAKVMAETMEANRMSLHGESHVSSILAGVEKGDYSKMSKAEAGRAKIDRLVDGMRNMQEDMKQSAFSPQQVDLTKKLVNIQRHLRVQGMRSPDESYYELAHGSAGFMTPSGQIDSHLAASLASPTGLATGPQLAIDTFGGENMAGLASLNKGISAQQQRGIANQQSKILDRMFHNLAGNKAAAGPNLDQVLGAKISRDAGNIVQKFAPKLLGNVKNKANNSTQGTGLSLGAGVGIAVGAYLLAQALRKKPAPELGNSPGRGGEYWEHEKRKKDEDTFNPRNKMISKSSSAMNALIATNMGSKNAYVSMDKTSNTYGSGEQILRRNMSMKPISQPSMSNMNYGGANTYARALAL